MCTTSFLVWSGVMIPLPPENKGKQALQSSGSTVICCAGGPVGAAGLSGSLHLGGHPVSAERGGGPGPDHVAAAGLGWGCLGHCPLPAGWHTGPGQHVSLQGAGQPPPCCAGPGLLPGAPLQLILVFSFVAFCLPAHSTPKTFLLRTACKHVSHVYRPLLSLAPDQEHFAESAAVYLPVITKLATASRCICQPLLVITCCHGPSADSTC